MGNPAHWRRSSPRVAVESMCWEIIDGKEITSMSIDLSTHGIRIERPYIGGGTRSEAQLEIEIPEIDEMMWAKGAATYDVLVQDKSPWGGPMGLVRRTGYRLVAGARRDFNRLSEYVMEREKAVRKQWYAAARALVDSTRWDAIDLPTR
jgi:hypothetical protein